LTDVTLEAAMSLLSHVICGIYEVGKFTDAKKLLKQIFGDETQKVKEKQ
jgi:hypothetical protein